MEKEKIIDKINLRFSEKGEKFILSENDMDKLAIDISRVMDPIYTEYINSIKDNFDLKINSVQKEKYRKYLIGYPVDLGNDIIYFESIPNFTEEILNKAYEFIIEGFNRKESVMINSIIARIKKNILLRNNHSNEDYIKYLKSLEKAKKQMLIVSVNSNDNFSSDNIAEIILKKYDMLSNYHYAIVIFEDDKINWGIISEVAIFMENMYIEYEFNVFNKKNKERRINDLTNFIQNNKNIKINSAIEKEIENFYSGVAFGFQFEDLFISDDGSKKILVMQKIRLDEKSKKCPSCFEEKLRGNSYPKILYRSFECQNENCPSRSKIGRGKRFDLFSAKRQSMLDRHDKCDYISDEVYNTFRKDIFEIDNFDIKKIIDLYSWKGDTIEIVNSKIKDFTKSYRGRKVVFSEFRIFDDRNLFNNLPIVKLMNSINGSINIEINESSVSYKNIQGSLVVNMDSTQGLRNINEMFNYTIGGAVTSPPYFNAREYSQWPNFICYLIDMMINAKSVYSSLHDEGKYIYNIGDIVGQDNVYINSNMSKRRLMLGFYSLFIFSIVGYKCLGNIIWNKGEVQSKRNSNSNHFPGYLKPVNVYEHCLLFGKSNKENYIATEIKRIDPVKKINSKGENILGHTAPYPKEVSKLIIPYINKEYFILDPYLGSGTTIMAMIDEGIKSIGFEINEAYYNLCIERISNNKSSR